MEHTIMQDNIKDQISLKTIQSQVIDDVRTINRAKVQVLINKNQETVTPAEQIITKKEIIDDISQLDYKWPREGKEYTKLRNNFHNLYGQLLKEEKSVKKKAQWNNIFN